MGKNCFFKGVATAVSAQLPYQPDQIEADLVRYDIQLLLTGVKKKKYISQLFKVIYILVFSVIYQRPQKGLFHQMQSRTCASMCVSTWSTDLHVLLQACI